MTNGGGCHIILIMKGNADKRTRTGAAVSAVGIACNLALAAAKITVGLLGGLVSVAADGFNNLSDCGSGVVSLVSFRISGKPADEKHPFGHRRAEYIAAMITGFIVLFLAVELCRESVVKIVEHELTQTSAAAYIVLGISVAVKAAMFVFYRTYALKLNSEALKAAAVDSLCDCAATAAAAVGLVVMQFAALPADGWAGAAVALFIVWQGVKILAEASSELLGKAPDPALTEKIVRIVTETDGVLGMHDLRVYSYGKGATFATVHIEMDAGMSALASHTVLDSIEHEVADSLGVSLTAHLDPVDLADEKAQTLEAEVRVAVAKIAEGAEIHDFRLIRGKTNKVIFDVGAPFSCKKTDDELRRETENAVRAMGDYSPVITIDRE